MYKGHVKNICILKTTSDNLFKSKCMVHTLEWMNNISTFNRMALDGLKLAGYLLKSAWPSRCPWV